jgi:hypothetical protein
VTPSAPQLPGTRPGSYSAARALSSTAQWKSLIARGLARRAKAQMDAGCKRLQARRAAASSARFFKLFRDVPLICV